MKIYYIYYHIDPRTNLPVYVGKGTGNRAYNFYGRNKDHSKWIKDLSKQNLIPEVFVGNEFYSEDEAYNVERQEISLFRKLNISLFNKSNGGRVTKHEKCNKAIICINNGKTYLSAKQASLELNIHAKRICDVLKGRKKSYKSYKFIYENRNFNIIPDRIRVQKTYRRKISTSKSVVCVETGAEFVSIIAASKWLNVSNSYVCQQLSGRVKTVKGFTFKRI